MDSGFPPALSRQVAAAGRIPLAVAVVDGDGRISHWSPGARRLFGHSVREATGRQAEDLMPVAGGLTDDETGLAHGRDTGSAAPPTAGRATVSAPDGARTDILWWVYPLRAGPTGEGGIGGGGHLVLAADGRRLTRGGALLPSHAARITPGFARTARFPGASRLAARLPYVLPAMGWEDAGRITDRVFELGYPVLESGRCRQVPITPVRYVPRQPAITACGSHAGSR